ncbi:hypothetical protein ACOSQ4_020264 [Xanthoceras sorbifolium]
MNGLEIRFLIFLSLVLQIILILFSARRKYTARNWRRILVWSSYMILHWVVTVALGHISNNQRDISHQGSSSTDPPPTPNNKLQEFWTPFLLVHLGGPDTITAYALEDNDMWLMHLLLHGVHVGTSVYIFVQAWERHPLMFVGIPILISGIINYGGKILALRSSSTQYLKDSLFSAPDSCSEFVKQIEKKGTHLKMQGDKLIVDNVSYVKSRNEFLAHKGDNALEKWHHLLRDHRFHWSTTQVEFDRSLLIWHIATDLCYSYDLDHVNGDDNKLHQKCKTSKHLSEYMLYLLVFCPSMLPKGPIGEIRYADTCAEAMEFFKKKNVITGSSKRCDIFEELLREDTEEDHHLLPSRPESEAARKRV